MPLTAKIEHEPLRYEPLARVNMGDALFKYKGTCEPRILAAQVGKRQDVFLPEEYAYEDDTGTELRLGVASPLLRPSDADIHEQMIQRRVDYLIGEALNTRCANNQKEHGWTMKELQEFGIGCEDVVDIAGQTGNWDAQLSKLGLK